MTIAPGMAHWIPLPYGLFKEFLHDPLDFQMWARERYGDVVRFRLGPLLIHYIYHPDHVRRVLHTHQKNYLRGWHFHLSRKMLGDNLVVSEGAHWLRQRRLAQPAFHNQRIQGYADVMVDATTQLLSRWEDAAACGKTIEITPEMARLALAIASRTLFDRDLSHEADAVGKAFGFIGPYLENRFNHPFTSPPTAIPTPANRRFQQAMHTLNELALALIRERRREGGDHGDLLSMLMQARDEETGEMMTDDQLRSEVIAFLLAGHETTATALTWTWYLLATHTDIQQRVRDEVSEVLGNRTPTVEDALNLDLTRRVIEEAMRLYPPIWAIPRQAIGDDEIGGFSIPAKSTALLCPFVTHRHPDIWERPEVFDPDRFTAERAAARPKFAYFPFLGGPHQCIGNEFAMLEMRLVVAMVVRQFSLELVSGQEIRAVTSLALKPNGPVRLRLRKVTKVTHCLERSNGNRHESPKEELRRR